MNRLIYTILCLVIVQSTGAQTVRKWKDLNYTGDTLTGHKMDIYLPDCGEGPFPVVVAIAGSAWFGNNTKARAYRQVEDLRAEGFAVVAVNHRSSREARFPAQIHDIKAAVRFIRGNASLYYLDTRFIGITGYSSGGHLSAMMGTTGGVGKFTVGATTLSIEGDLGAFSGQSSHVDAVVDWYGPTDFLVMDSCGSRLHHNAPDSPESVLTGGAIQENREMCRLANPMTYIDEKDAPVLILHGEADSTVPFCQSLMLFDAMQRNGVPCKLINVPGAGHGKGMWLPEYREEMIRFFKSEYNRKLSCDQSPTEYRLYFLGGQSNMVGFGFNDKLPPELDRTFGNVMIFHGSQAPDYDDSGGRGIWEKLRPGHGLGFECNSKENLLSDRFGPELSFGAMLSREYPGQKIAIIKYARGGTSLDRRVMGFGTWAPDDNAVNGINQYDHFLSTLENAFDNKDIDGDGKEDRLVPAGIIWMQGEADAEHSEAAARAYEENLRRMMDLIRAALRKDDLPVVIGKIADSGADTDGKVMEHIDIVHQAQEEFVKSDPCAALVTETENYGFLPDRWHYTSEAYIDLGERFAEKVVRLERLRNTPPQVIGDLVEIPVFASFNIRQHAVDILLPPAYDPSRNYPVLYMHDGQNLYRSITERRKGGWGNQAWRVDEVLDSLYKSGTVPEIIVVGIHNNRNYRISEYMPQKSNPGLDNVLAGDRRIALEAAYRIVSDDYLKFIVTELKPYIDTHYSTMPDRDHTLIMGSSMGGLISMYALCEYPEVFGKAACLSTHWQADDGVFIDRYLDGAIPEAGSHRIYFDHGTEGLDAYYEPYQKKVDHLMVKKGYGKDVNFMSVKYDGHDHNENAWNRRLHVPLEFLLKE